MGIASPIRTAGSSAPTIRKFKPGSLPRTGARSTCCTPIRAGRPSTAVWSSSWPSARSSLPTVRRTAQGSHYFYTRREGHENQPVLWVRDGAAGEERQLVDPNSMSTDGTVALDWYVPSTEGALLAYGVSEGGSEESTLAIRDVATGKDLPDRITRARYSSVCWLPGGKRFYYSRFPAPGSVPKGEEKYHRRIYEHVIGRAADSDPLVFESKEMTDFPSCTISPNGRWLLVRVHQGWSKSSVWLADTSKPKLAFRELTSNEEHVYDPLAIDDRDLRPHQRGRRAVRPLRGRSQAASPQPLEAGGTRARPRRPQ